MRGVIYIALLEKYNEGQGKTSLVGALNSGCLCFLCEYHLSRTLDFDNYRRFSKTPMLVYPVELEV